MSIYEDHIQEIDLAIAQNSHKWTLKARCDLDFSDVSQMLRLHVYNKFSLWKQELPLGPWLHRLIRNQIINILRNFYSGMSRPCLRCSCAVGDDMCSLYKKQCADCPLYAKWEKTKKKKANVHLPVSLEHHSEMMYNMPNQDINFDKAIPALNFKLKSALKPNEWKFYELMYIQNKSENEVIKIMDFKNTEKKASHRFKRMQQIQKIVMDKAAAILKEDGIEI